MGLVKSLQQSASETALCVDIRLAAAILTNLLSKQPVCLFTSSTSSGGKYVQIPRASVKLLVTYLCTHRYVKFMYQNIIRRGTYTNTRQILPDTLTALILVRCGS